jgi:hypothetical protein
MAQTIKEICSDIINDLRSYNLDERISYRFIKNKLIDNANYFTKQDAELRKITKLTNLWQPLDCVEMVEVPLSNCGGAGCKKIMRSTIKIPETYQTGYGYSLKVFNNDYTKEYNPTQPSYYRDIVNRPFPTKNGYYWLVDGYLYIPDSEVEEVQILGMFKETLNLSTDGCPKPLDTVFTFPDYIVTISKKETLKELLGSHKQINPDDTPNLNVKPQE